MRNDAGDKRTEARIKSGLPFSYRKHWLTDIYFKNRFGFKSDFIFFLTERSEESRYEITPYNRKLLGGTIL